MVGTPGRVLDHLSRGTLTLENVRYVVLDEADRMLDIGFRPDIEKILRRLPARTGRPCSCRPRCRRPSAPGPALHDRTVTSTCRRRSLTVDKIDQKFITVDEDHKFDLLVKVLEREKPRQCIIFVERKRWADELYRHLAEFPRRSPIHGDLAAAAARPHHGRLPRRQVTYLIATDVMSRGIDVSGISHIINYDLPNDSDNYVHRIGRTGRMGADGVAISFVTPEQGEVLTAIETNINRLIPEDRIDGFEAFAPRAKMPDGPPQPTQPAKPKFGRPTKRYSNRL